MEYLDCSGYNLLIVLLLVIDLETEPTEPGPLGKKTIFDCREEQYPCTRLYSVHKPCKQCLNSLCFYSLRRVYIINKEVCVRTVCAHEELLRGKFTVILWNKISLICVKCARKRKVDIGL
uniref:Uncharacterized protein n=1 Tax=Periophthalmus magnuspinnatus TaxID=409849 RepID=A0A3B3ZJF0_9GOBI